MAVVYGALEPTELKLRDFVVDEMVAVLDSDLSMLV